MVTKKLSRTTSHTFTPNMCKKLLLELYFSTDFPLQSQTGKPTSNGCSVFISIIPSYNADCKFMGHSTIYIVSPLLYPDSSSLSQKDPLWVVVQEDIDRIGARGRPSILVLPFPFFGSLSYFIFFFSFIYFVSLLFFHFI